MLQKGSSYRKPIKLRKMPTGRKMYSIFLCNFRSKLFVADEYLATYSGDGRSIARKSSPVKCAFLFSSFLLVNNAKCKKYALKSFKIFLAELAW